MWGKDWIQAKTQAECYDYLFEAAVKMAQLGIDASVAPPPPLITANGAAAAAEGKRHAENGVSAGGALVVVRFGYGQAFLRQARASAYLPHCGTIVTACAGNELNDGWKHAKKHSHSNVSK